MNSILELSKRTVFLTIAIVNLVIITYSILTKSYSALFRINTLILVLAVLTELSAWFVSAIRLRILHRILDSSGKTLSIKHYFYARMLGGLLAYLTPSAIGGEPARAYYLHLKIGEGFPRYLALSIYEVFYDIIIVNVLAIIFSINKIPYTIPVILVSSLSLITWIIVYSIFKNILPTNNTSILISKFVKFIETRLMKRFTSISKSYLDFGTSFREIASRVEFRDRVIVIYLTITMYLLSSLTITLIALSIDYEKGFVKQFIESFQAFLFALSLGALPTPGGSVAVEYGLSIVLMPSVVVVSRTLSYYIVIITGLLILFSNKLIILTTKETKQ